MQHNSRWEYVNINCALQILVFLQTAIPIVKHAVVNAILKDIVFQIVLICFLQGRGIVYAGTGVQDLTLINWSYFMDVILLLII